MVRVDASLADVNQAYKAHQLSISKVARLLGVTQDRYWQTLKRYCGGRPHPKGPQSAEVKHMLGVTTKLLIELPLCRNGTPIDMMVKEISEQIKKNLSDGVEAAVDAMQT